MLDTLLKYLSLITVAGAAISFVIGLLKFIDQRNREERTKRYMLYHDLMRTISAYGDGENGKVALTQQAAAIYELQHFKEYAYASVPGLRFLREAVGESDKSDRRVVLLLQRLMKRWQR
jgi:hypothetical protein